MGSETPAAPLEECSCRWDGLHAVGCPRRHAPAAPLEKAVEEARKAKRYDLESSGGYGPYREMVARLDGEWVDSAVLLRLLAALDADRGEAEAVLRTIRDTACDPAALAAGYFARREGEKGGGTWERGLTTTWAVE